MAASVSAFHKDICCTENSKRQMTATPVAHTDTPYTPADDTLYFRCFGDINDVTNGADHDVDDHNNNHRHEPHHINQRHPHHHHSHAHHQPAREDYGHHHLRHTRIPHSRNTAAPPTAVLGHPTPVAGSPSSADTLAPLPPIVIDAMSDHASVNSRCSDIAGHTTTTVDSDRLSSNLFQSISSNESLTGGWRTTSKRWPFSMATAMAVLTLCSAFLQPVLASKSEGCTFPSRWEGSWFLSGNQQPVFIKGSTLSFRGKCIASEGDKFLVVDDKGCHRCLVMYEKHRNVLQYKESECEGDNMYMDQSNPAAMAVQQHPLRSILNSDHRGAAHPNTNGGNGHSRQSSSSDPYSMRSHGEMSNDCPSDYCKGRETLQTLCEQIAGDALLYSLFKENAEPVKCPLRGPYTFTYNRGHGECTNPVSNIDSCTEDSRLLLSFQACHDVSGTESTVEELTCLATWKDGNSRYLVGLVSHHHAISNEERYRCFVYEKIMPSNGGNSKDEYKLAQSGDATCNGLDSAEVGSRIMTLRMAPSAERCDFPAWFKGPKHWHALMGNTGYIFHQTDGSLHIAKPNGFMETRALCEQINKQTPTEMMSVVHYTTGCQSGFMCMMFYRRDTHVAEIQMGTPATRLEDACAPDHFDVNKLPYITLLANNPESQQCPLQGLYGLRGAVGPPYISSRHKRNHNNKAHLHHHHASNGHRRHSTLSFRNSDEFDHGSWRSASRGIPKRNRRETDFTTFASSSDAIIGDADDDSEDDQPLAPPPTPPRRLTTRKRPGIRNATEDTLTDSKPTASGQQPQRSRRDTPGCVVNYNSARQLLIGCAQPNVIEVRPQCNEEGDEVYSCHGSWVENDTTFIIARHAGSQHGVCISFMPQEGNAAKLVVGDACRRNNLSVSDHHLTANLTVYGSCSDPSSSNALSSSWFLACAVPLVWTVLERFVGPR